MALPAEIGEILARAEGLAEGVSKRTRLVAWLTLAMGAGAWVLLLRAWVLDSWKAALAWSPLLLVLLIPGLILLSFARRSGKLADLRAAVADDVGELVDGAREQVAQGIAEVKGRQGLTALLGSLGDLREYGDEGRSIIARIVGTARLLNPMYLGLVGLASLAVVLVVLVLVVGLVTLLF